MEELRGVERRRAEIRLEIAELCGGDFEKKLSRAIEKNPQPPKRAKVSVEVKRKTSASDRWQKGIESRGILTTDESVLGALEKLGEPVVATKVCLQLGFSHLQPRVVKALEDLAKRGKVTQEARALRGGTRQLFSVADVPKPKRNDARQAKADDAGGSVVFSGIREDEIIEALRDGPKHALDICRFHGLTESMVGPVIVAVEKLVDACKVDQDPDTKGNSQRKVYRLAHGV